MDLSYLWKIHTIQNLHQHKVCHSFTLLHVTIPASVLPLKTLQVQACTSHNNVDECHQERDICADSS